MLVVLVLALSEEWFGALAPGRIDEEMAGMLHYSDP